MSTMLVCVSCLGRVAALTIVDFATGSLPPVEECLVALKITHLPPPTEAPSAGGAPAAAAASQTTVDVKEEAEEEEDIEAWGGV